MLKNISVTLLFVFLLTACTTTSPERGALRIDATTIGTAEASYNAMMKRRSDSEQLQLALAVLALNMEGVKSALEVVNNPELQSPSIGRIKDKVAGMTAEQIIELAAQNPSVNIEVVR